MKFGKLNSLTGVDFRLPPDYAQNPAWDKGSTAAYYIGATAWTTKQWRGTYLPAKSSTEGPLHHYSRQFNSIELNTTFYRLPTDEVLEQWKNAVPSDFRFCPKVSRNISHSKDLSMSRDGMKTFIDKVSLLQENLGMCFMQLPEYFGPDRIHLLHSFFRTLPSNLPLGIELRHEGFYDPEMTPRIFELFSKHKISWVLTDVAGRRDMLHMALCCDEVMIRFVGNGLHKTDYSRTDEWAIRISSWIDKGVKKVYFFPHEPDNVLTPEMSIYVNEKLQKNTKATGRAPQAIQTDVQGSLF